MTTPTRRRPLRARLLALIADATNRLTAAWRVLTRAQTALLDALARIRPGRTAYARIRAVGEAFQRQIAAFDRAAIAFAERWAATDLPAAYREGALTALDHGPLTVRWAWTSRHQAAITTLSAQYYTDLIGRIREAVRRARAFLRDALAAARARLDRYDPARTSRTRLLRDHPLDTVLYAGSSRHPVDAWARAAVAWQAVTTANAGLLRTCADELGADWVEVHDGPDCGWTSHSDADRADGTLRTIQDALAHPAAHPHCQRAFRPRPDVISRPDYAFGGPF
ncbi:hypothetical protein [Streptomyces roseoviridis]|uniref:Phage head morphogenesis domain-containing protein n=1 Tax=Streptomyces roseoviridis TaxID=67361 RepID=A0ABV5R157_9ACTN